MAPQQAHPTVLRKEHAALTEAFRRPALLLRHDGLEALQATVLQLT